MTSRFRSRLLPSTSVAEWLPVARSRIQDFDLPFLGLLVDTAAPGATTTVTLPLGGTVNCIVDWGDDLSDTYTTTGNKTHTYAVGGKYTIRIRGVLTGFGATLSRPWLVGWFSFGDTGITSLFRGFRLSANLVSAPNTINVNVTTLSNCFNTCSTFNGNISGWYTGSVATMNGMFQNASAFNQNISRWNTSNVTDMVAMFRSATAFNQDISGWYTGSVTDMGAMFRGATSFEQDLGEWRPSRCTSFLDFLRDNTLSTVNYDGLLTGWTDFTGSNWDSGSISSFADPGGGQVTVNTATAHGYANNHVMRITGTTNYDGSYVISNVTATSFEITATFVATETGTWNATLQSGVTFDGGGSQYSVGAATTARGVLTGAPYNWTITDGGQA